MTAEVYGYGVKAGREFTYDGGTKVDYSPTASTA
jgi:alpha-amylase